jgi:hypothetical protein
VRGSDADFERLIIRKITMMVDGREIVRKLELDRVLHPELAVRVLHIDPSNAIARLQRAVCQINQLDEVIESHEPIRLRDDDLSRLSFILNKRYQSGLIYEIDDYEEEDPFPIIVVGENERTYDIRTMSLGEISVFSIFWNLHRAESSRWCFWRNQKHFYRRFRRARF